MIDDFYLVRDAEAEERDELLFDFEDKKPNTTNAPVLKRTAAKSQPKKLATKPADEAPPDESQAFNPSKSEKDKFRYNINRAPEHIKDHWNTVKNLPKTDASRQAYWKAISQVDKDGWDSVSLDSSVAWTDSSGNSKCTCRPFVD